MVDNGIVAVFWYTKVALEVFSRVRRDSRLGLDFSYFSVQISRLGLVSVSENHFTEVSVSSRSQKRLIKNSRLVSSLEFLE